MNKVTFFKTASLFFFLLTAQFSYGQQCSDYPDYSGDINQYSIGDRVHYQGSIWQSRYGNNSTAPSGTTNNSCDQEGTQWCFVSSCTAGNNPCETTTEITFDDFQSGWGNWNDGGNDCFIGSYDNGCLDNSQKILLRDNSGTKSSLISDTYNLSSYDEITVEFDYLVSSFEYNEEWFIEFSANNGGSWTQIKQYIRRWDGIANDVCYNESVTVLATNQTFNSQNKLRFRANASGNGDLLYIDNIKVLGTDATTPTTPTADFTASANAVDTTQTINFTNNSTNASSYSWNFGDGTTSIETSPNKQFASAGSYTVTLTATNSCGSDTATEDITVYAPGTCSAVGTILMEKYDGITGTSIASLTGSANYPENPSSDEQLTSFEISTNTDDFYGVRVNGYICAPQTGYYTFWIASDDNGQLNLSTDDDPANKTTIATVDSWTGSQEWDEYDSQKSDPILLIMGESYYVEALMKEDEGGDNLAVGWSKPGEPSNIPSEVIPGSVLSPVESCSTLTTYNLTTNEPDLCTGDATSIDLSGSQDGVSYQLKKEGDNEGDPITGDGNAISFTGVTNAGEYTVEASSCSDTLTMTGSVTITTTTTPTPYAISADTTSLCSEQEATITVADSESGVSYQLKKDGDNEGSPITGDGNAISFTGVTTAGTYTVIASSSNTTCSVAMTGSIVITTAISPTANFTASATTIEAASSITFTDTSTGSPTSWSWDFNDDGIEDSTDQNPTHPFNTVGTFTVTLTATNSCGNDTETKVDYITVTQAPEDIAIQDFDGATPSWSYTNILGSPTVNLFFEDLTGESDGDTTGAASGINWALSGGGGSNSELYVHGGSGDHVHMSYNDGTIAVWETTQGIDIASYGNLNFTVKVRKTNNLNNDDYVTLLYSKNGGAPIEIATYYDDMDDDTIIGGDINSLTGNTLIGNPGDTIKLFMYVRNNSSDEQFEWEEIKLTGNVIDGTINSLGTNPTTAWGNSGATAVAQITFDTIDTSYGENLTFSFDYFIDSETETSGGPEDNFVYDIYYNGSETASASDELIVDGGARDTWTSKSVSVPDGTTSVKVIFNYDVTDASNEHLGLDNVKIKGIIDCSLANNNVTSVGATNDDSQASITWNPPTGPCFTIDEYLVIAKQGSAVATSPSGDGSAYTASAAFGSALSAFDGGFVVYKGGAETVTITGLVNFVTYHATLFTRSGTTWSSGETILVTPSVSENLFYEDFQDEVGGDTSGIDDVNQITWNTNQNNSNPDEFAVDEDGSVHHFEADGTNNIEADWYTDPINISGYDNLKLSLFVREDASSGDIIKLRYSLDNGTTKISVNSSSSTISGGSGDDEDYEFSFTDDLTAVDNLQIYITFITNSDQFKIDDVKLTGESFYNVWQGEQDDLVTTNSNWSKESVPTATSNVLVPSTKHLTLEDDREFNAIKVESSANLTIEKTGSLTTIGDFTKIAGTGTVTLNSDSNEFASIVVEGSASGDITYNKYVNYVGSDEWDLVGSPVTTQSISSFVSINDDPLAVDPTGPTYYAIGTHDAVTDSWTNYTGPNGDQSVNDAGNFTPAKGYQMATDYGATMAFTGEVATTTQQINIQKQTVMWNLVANPFPSYIKGNIAADATHNFLKVNADAGIINGGNYLAAYGWKADGSGYEPYNYTTGSTGDFSPLLIAPGQGFFVAANSTSPRNLIFTPQMRTTAGGDDFINGAPILLNYNFNLKLFHGNSEKAETSYFFQEGLTLGLDPGYDAGALDQLTPLSSRLPEAGTGVNFQINAMSLESAYNQTIPLVINQQEGQSFRISISNNTLPEDINVYLEDVLNGTLTPLNEQDFELSAQEDLSDAGRFYLHFTTQSLAIDDVLNPNNINLYKLNTDTFITIKGLTPDMGKTNAALYNILGMKVRQKALDNSQDTQHISTQGLAGGVYIIKLNAGDVSFSKKVIIQ